MDPTLQLKLAALVIVAAGGIVGALLPWSGVFASRNQRSELYISLGNAFAAGVLLGAGLIHMLGDAASAFPVAWPDLRYPGAFLIAGAGFLLILFIERVAVRSHAFTEVELADPHGDGAAPRIYAYVLLLALSVHSIFAGLALGVQSDVSGSIVILAAILAHKSVAAFALGVSFRRENKTRAEALKPLALFIAMTPLGILAGMLLKSAADGPQEAEIEALFNAIAAGTFLYIAALDIMAEEFLRPGRKALKFGLCALGFAIMALIAVWI